MNTKYQGLQRARAYGMPRTFARISETTTKLAKRDSAAIVLVFKAGAFRY